MPVESANKQRTALRKKVTNKDELITYLNAHPDSELPFVELCWMDAVQKTDENKGKEDNVQYKIVIDKDGNEKKVCTHRTRYITDPCRMYFKLMSLHKYSSIGEKLKYDKQKAYDNEREVFKIYLNRENEREQMQNEIIEWIEMFKPDEREFLKKRYAAYYDTYDINDGADRVALKRLLSLEVESFRIDIKRAEGKSVNVGDEKKVNEMIQSTLESLKWTKKQRSAREDMAKNRFTIFMETMMDEGEFKPNKVTFQKDDIDFIIDQIVENTKRLLV